MMCRRLCGVLLLALLTAACGSPTVSVPTDAPAGSPDPTEVSTPVDSPQTADPTTTTRAPNTPAKRTPQPKAKGQPLDIFLPFETGLSYPDKKPRLEEEIRKGCGGTLCVKVALIVKVTRDPSTTVDCSVSGATKPNPIFAGDTINVYIEDPCDGKPPGKQSSGPTTTTPA